MTEADIKRLQTVGEEAQAARHEFILKDDQDAVWRYFKTLRNARVDIVLDNCEFHNVLTYHILTINMKAGFEVGDQLFFILSCH